MKKACCKRTFVLITSALFLVFIIASTFWFFYLKNVNIYEPITIKINGLSVKGCKVVEVVSTTPLNKKIRISYVDSLKAWYYYYSFHKQINVIIPDTILQKSVDFEIQIGDKKFFKKIKDFDLIKHNKSYTEYALPLDVKSKKSVSGMLFSAFHWSMIRMILKLLFLFSLLFLIIINRKKTLTIFIILKKNIKISIQFIYKILKNVSIFALKIIKIATSYIINILIINPSKLFIIFLKKLIIESLILLRFIKENIYLYVKIFKERFSKTYYTIIVTIFSIFIAFYLFYGSLFYKFTYVSFFSLFLFYLLLYFLIVLAIFKLVNRIKYRVLRKIVLVLIMVFFSVLSFFEIYLRIIQRNASYNEKTGLPYMSGFQKENHINIINLEPKTSIIDKKEEFSYTITSNSDGFRDDEFIKNKDKDEYRIICIGNSFTMGIGTPQDSTWPRLLEKKIINYKNNKRVKIYNGGINGSDPFNEYYLLKNKLLKYKPDLVIMALCYSDTSFYHLRGGFERFTSKGIKYRKAPLIEPLYALSFSLRFIMNDLLHYYCFLSPEKYKKDTEKSFNDIYKCVLQTNNLTDFYHSEFLLICNDDFNDTYRQLLIKLEKETTIPNFYLKDYFEKVLKLDKYKRSNNYYWKKDMHHNPRGYNLYAEAVVWKLKQMGIIDTTTKIINKGQ